MADNGLQNMDETSQQAEEAVKEKAKAVADKAGNKVKNIAKKGVKKVGKKAGQYIGKGAKKLGKKVAHGAAKAVKAAIKAIIQIAKMFIQALIKLIALLGWPLLIIIIIIIIFSLLWVFKFEERGSTQSNDLMPGTENPTYVDEQTAVTTAVAMTEPQAVIDAYYKYMSTQSFIKEYDGKLYEFADEDDTADFSALRDYYDKENNFYLSDDFIRLLDEVLHTDDFYYPEQIIKPVYGRQLNLTDRNGDTVLAYASLLPMDYASGEKSVMFEDNFEDPEDALVIGFDEMVTDRSQLDNPDIENASDDVTTLVALSQKPKEVTSSDPSEAGLTFYALEERDTVAGTGAAGEVPGLWDYGFGSVLQYEPHQKIQYITCSYTDVDVDIHVRSRHWIEGDEDEDGHWSDWSDWKHSRVYSMSLEGVSSKTDLDTKIKNYLDSINPSTSTYEVEYDYNLPTNINAILSDDTTWDTSNELNAANESQYARGYSNSHIDMKVEGAKDIDISRLEFSGDLEAFSNHGSALYPLNIALISHAATFSGNINYTITPAGEEGCTEVRKALNPNTDPSIDHREPVKTVVVAGGCGEVELTATRDGEVVTQTPKVEETDAPWGFQYIQEYAENYRAYVPSDYTQDRDFFLRSGLEAVQHQLEGNATDADNKNAQQYADNLEFLMNLGLLKLYAGGSLSAMGTVNVGDMNVEGSDLYILAKLIGAEAASGDKLDELLVGATFVNRVKSDLFPNTYWEVLTQDNPIQYSSYYNGSWAANNPTPSQVASAMQVMSGQFALPANVVFQSQNQEGDIFMTNGVHYYCYPRNTTLDTQDAWGRAALNPDQLRDLAKQLDDVDPNEISGEGINFDPSTSIFIGDSLTVGLNSAVGLTNEGATVIAKEGAGLDAIRQMVEKSDSSAWSGKERVYVLAGTNSSTMQQEPFRDQYNALLDAIREKAPTGITIILTSMPPVVDGVKSHNTSNAWINSNNDVIEEIANKNGFPLLDIWSQLQDRGVLNSAYDVGDGIHLNNAGYKVWYSMVRGGITSSSIGAGTEVDLDGLTTQETINGISSDYNLYEIENFDVLSAVNMQAALTTEDETAWNWIESLWGTAVDFGEGVAGAIKGFFESMDSLIFPTDKGIDKCITAATSYNVSDVQSVIYSTITFSSQVWFSTAEDAADQRLRNGDITFLFVGKDAILGLGTGGIGASATMVPGTGTTIDGLISPTDEYFKPLSPFDGTAMEVGTLEGTKILAVGDGEIVKVETSNSSASSMGKYVVQQIDLPDGRRMEVTYGFLDEVSVSAPSTVTAGTQIGISGTNPDGAGSLYFSVSIDGQYVDPMSIFYQSTLVYGAGSLGQNLNNADGTVNMEALKQLREELNQMVGLEPNMYGGNDNTSISYDGWTSFDPTGKMPYFTKPFNGMEPLQCTWWARARGLQYVMTFYPGQISADEFASSNHGNGGEVYGYAKAYGLFGTGTTPKPNSLVSFTSNSGAGHVAYVEAVDYVNQVYYCSEAGSGKYWGSVNLIPYKFCAPGETAQGNYNLIGFVYLDEILR